MPAVADGGLGPRAREACEEREDRAYVPVLLDRFQDDVAAGEVLGTACEVGGPRQGVDHDRILSVDDGALRIAWFPHAGWQRETVAYGPFHVEPGFTFVATLVNGLTHSQTSPHPAGRVAAVRRWLRTFPRVIWHEPAMADNLAVGIFRHAVPNDPTRDGWCFVNRANELDRGELVGATDHDRLCLLPVLANVQYVYVAVVRDDAVVLYAGGAPGTRGVAVHPEVRPLGVMRAKGLPTGERYVGIHQAVLGEAGYPLDTRVSEVRAAADPALSNWWTTAHAADSLEGSGEVGGSEPDVGPVWTADGLVRNPGGAAGDGRTLAVPSEPSGLVRVTLTIALVDARVALVFRGATDGTSWRFEVGPNGATLTEPSGRTLRSDARVRLSIGERHSLQVVDGGDSLGLSVDESLLFDGFVAASDDAHEGCGVGFELSGDPGARVSRFEAHPRAVRIDAVVEARAPWSARGTTLVDVGDFGGPAGELDTPVPGRPAWERLEGVGVVERTGDGRARVRASRQDPNPGRTLYGVRWPHPEFADVSVTLTPPGRRRGEGHWGLSGIAVWQDRDNYLLVHECLGDTNVGISINAFLHMEGAVSGHPNDDDPAVWNNVAGHVMHGEPMLLRVACDGVRFDVWADDELVLARALADIHPGAAKLTINRVGLAANWDWGDDTGSEFCDFSARR